MQMVGAANDRERAQSRLEQLAAQIFIDAIEAGAVGPLSADGVKVVTDSDAFHRVIEKRVFALGEFDRLAVGQLLLTGLRAPVQISAGDPE